MEKLDEVFIRGNIYSSFSGALSKKYPLYTGPLFSKLALLWRHFYQADRHTLCHLYKTLVLPKLDYCSNAWDPHTITLINNLESVQTLAVKLCTKSWSARSSNLINSLHWPTLRSRRSRLKVQLSCGMISINLIIPSSPT